MNKSLTSVKQMKFGTKFAISACKLFRNIKLRFEGMGARNDSGFSTSNFETKLIEISCVLGGIDFITGKQFSLLISGDFFSANGDLQNLRRARYYDLSRLDGKTLYFSKDPKGQWKSGNYILSPKY